jgi:hypothetical protein
LKRFEQYFRRANDPYQSPSVERGGVEKTLEALDRAGRDAVTTFNKPALEDTLRVLRQAIRHAAGQLEAANNSAAAPSEQVDDRPSPVESPLESATPSEMVNGSGPDVSPQTEQQALIQKFMDRVLREKKKRIRKTDIWRLAGYTEATEFERYQRNDPKTSDGARHKFGLILSMDPEKFLERLAEAHSK